MRSSLTTRAPAARPGFSLTELVVVIVLLGIVFGAIMSVIMKQQQFYRGANDIIDTRAQLRQPITLLPTELRSISMVGPNFDLVTSPAPTDSSIRFRNYIASAVTCRVRPLFSQIVIPPSTPMKKKVPLAGPLGFVPAAGDSVLIYDGTVEKTPTQSPWRAYRVAMVTPDTRPDTVCSPFATTAIDIVGPDTGRAYVVTLDGAVAPTLVGGTPVRFFRVVKYGLYQENSGRWYLGYFDCSRSTTAGCGDKYMPVSGPYRPYVPPSGGLASPNSGLSFEYFDSLGTPVSGGGGLLGGPGAWGSVRRIRVTVRGRTLHRIQGKDFMRDSLTMHIAVRNIR